MNADRMIRHVVINVLLTAVFSVAAVAAGMDRHPELKSRPLAWTAYDGSFLVDTTSRAEMLDFYWNVFAAPYVKSGWTGSLATQTPGETSEQYRLREYAQLNAYRAMNYSLAMSEDASRLPLVQAGALVMALNVSRGLSHRIDETWIGYNALAAQAAATSLLGGGEDGNDPLGGEVDRFIADMGDINAAKVGHRATLLHDATVSGTLGFAYSGTAGRSVFHYTNSAEDDDPAMFVAWPAPGYMPIRLLGSRRWPDDLRSYRWSFAMRGDNVLARAFDAADVTVKVDGRTVPVKNVARPGGMFGITWGFEPSDFDLAAITDGTVVEVTVSGVTGVPYGDPRLRTFTYKVTFFDPEVVKTGISFQPTTPLLNISTRATIGRDAQQLIAGFWIDGTLPVRVAVRTQGPGLKQWIANAAQETRLTIFDSEGKVMGENDGWRNHSNWRLMQSLGVAPGNDDEAAMVLTLWPGHYSAVVSDDIGTDGVGIVEVFNIDNLTPARLSNLSTRGMVGTEERAMMAGFIITGHAPRQVVIRTQGPGLAKWGLSPVVTDTELSIVSMADGHPVIATNDDWKTRAENARLKADLAGYAPSDDREAALVVTLQPGAYSAVVSAKAAEGLGLIELFELGTPR